MGVCWSAETDEFCSRVMVKQLPATRRNLLSIISSVFDPLGLMSPFIMKAKVILQELCREGISMGSADRTGAVEILVRSITRVRRSACSQVLRIG